MGIGILEGLITNHHYGDIGDIFRWLDEYAAKWENIPVQNFPTIPTSNPTSRKVSLSISATRRAQPNPEGIFPESRHHAQSDGRPIRGPINGHSEYGRIGEVRPEDRGVFERHVGLPDHGHPYGDVRSRTYHAPNRR